MCSLHPVRCAFRAYRCAHSSLQVCSPGLCQVCSPWPVTCGHSTPACRTFWVACSWLPVSASGQQPSQVLYCTVFLRPQPCPVEHVGTWSHIPSVHLALLHMWALARPETSPTSGHTKAVCSSGGFHSRCHRGGGFLTELCPLSWCWALRWGCDWPCCS